MEGGHDDKDYTILYEDKLEGLNNKIDLIIKMLKS